jgi:hypothetical protein
MDELRTKGKAATEQKMRIEKDVESFDTQQGQQLNFMRKAFPESAQGWDWIQNNQDKFEKEVFGPPMISCNVKDERYSDQIQSLLQVDDFTCFTAQTKNDYKTLTDQLYREMSLSVVVRSCAQSIDSFRPPISQEEAKDLQLDGFAIDYLDGPRPVLAMLCAEKRLHNSGVALQDHTDDQYDKLVSNGRVNSWAAGKHSYTVRRRREYGPQAMTTVTKTIQKGRFWSSQPVDSQERAELKRCLDELRGDVQMMKDEMRKLKATNEEIEGRKGDILDKIVRRYIAQ